MVQKTSDFSKFMVCRHGQKWRGIEPVGTFWVRGSIFHDFVQTSFMDDP